MNNFKRLSLLLFLGAILFAGLGFLERSVTPGKHNFDSTVEAIVGRPLTPVSVAGVARRTARRTVRRRL
jgi:hypothetical protein